MRVSWFFFAALVVLSSCVTPPPPGGAANPTPVVKEDPAQQVERATLLMRQNDYQEASFREADRILSGIIASRDFETLDAAHRHAALLFDGIAALQLRDPQRGLTLLKRASDMPEAGPLDWFARVRGANAANDPHDAGSALVVLATRWPQALARFETPEIREYLELERALVELQESGSDSDRYTVLSALFDTHFAEEPDDAGTWWRDFALLQLARGQTTAALATLTRITNPYSVVSIEADKRFDSIRREVGTRLDVARAAEQAIAARLREAQESPATLRPMFRLMEALAHSQRFQQELQVADTAIERQEASGRQVYGDFDSYYLWILNDRAYALYSLGRWDAAVIQMDAASHLSDGGAQNISQVVNLTLMNDELGRPEQALKALERAGPASPYGDVVAQTARLDAALQLGDAKTVSHALRFISEHRHDNLSGYQEALLIAGREDESAQLLISRLADPRLRSAALLAVQQYAPENLPPRILERQRRWDTLVARPDVQEAIRRVGYVKRYQLQRSDY